MLRETMFFKKKIRIIALYVAIHSTQITNNCVKFESHKIDDEA